MLRSRTGAALSEADRRGQEPERVHSGRRRPDARAGESGRRAACTPATPARWSACRSRTRTCSSPRAGAPRPARRCCRTTKARSMRPWSRVCRTPAWCAWARPIWTSSRWARPTRIRTSVPVQNPWDRQGCAGRFVGRLGCGGGRASRARCHRHRHRRLDSPAGVVLRHHRHQADVRPRVALRDDRVRVVAGSGRPDGPDRRGLRDAAQRHGRFR